MMLSHNLKYNPLANENWRAQALLPWTRIKKIMRLEEIVQQEMEREGLAEQQEMAAPGQHGVISLHSPPSTNSRRFKIAGEAPVLIGRACELLIQDLTVRAWLCTGRNRRKTLLRQDIHTAIGQSEIFDFLVDVVPRVPASRSTLHRPVLPKHSQQDQEHTLHSSAVQQQTVHLSQHQAPAIPHDSSPITEMSKLSRLEGTGGDLKTTEMYQRGRVQQGEGSAVGTRDKRIRKDATTTQIRHEKEGAASLGTGPTGVVCTRAVVQQGQCFLPAPQPLEQPPSRFPRVSGQMAVAFPPHTNGAQRSQQQEQQQLPSATKKAAISLVQMSTMVKPMSPPPCLAPSLPVPEYIHVGKVEAEDGSQQQREDQVSPTQWWLGL